MPDDYTGYYYGPDHPMKPQRIAMTHQLVLGYGLHRNLDVYVRRLHEMPGPLPTKPLPPLSDACVACVGCKPSPCVWAPA